MNCGYFLQNSSTYSFVPSVQELNPIPPPLKQEEHSSMRHQ